MRVQITGPFICSEKEEFAEELAEKLDCEYLHIDVEKLVDMKKFEKMTDSGEAFLKFHEVMLKRLTKTIENLPDNVVIDFSPIDILVTVLINSHFVISQNANLTKKEAEGLNGRLFDLENKVAELSKTFTYSIHLPARKASELFDGTSEQCALVTYGYLAKIGLNALSVTRDRTSDPKPCIEPVIEEMEKLDLRQAENELSRLRSEKITCIN